MEPSASATGKAEGGLGQLNRFGVDRRGKRLWCHWPWSTMVLTCDGTVVCGCGDAFNENPMGRVGERSALEIWNGEGFRRMRQGMRDNRPPPFCYKCGLMEVHPPGDAIPDWPVEADRAPRILYVEPTIVCNLRCPQPACEPDEVYGTRATRLLDVDLYTQVLEEVGPELERVVFYNYGESFIHPRALEMLAKIKQVNPAIWVWTSTNGHYFDTDEKAHALVDSGVNEIQFSIDGATQEVYGEYRRHGKLDKVLRGIRAITAERDRRGTPYPWVVWNYILFRWNDGDAEMERARELAIELGVDRLTFTTTDQPPGMPSERFVEGSADLERIRTALVGGGVPKPNAIRWRAEMEALHPVDRVARGGVVALDLRVRNTGDLAWDVSLAGKARAIRAGADLYRQDGSVAREVVLVGGIEQTVDPGAETVVRLVGRIHEPPGRYRLKVDMVRELLWRFCETGSEPLWLDVEVVEGTVEAPVTVESATTRLSALTPLRIEATVRGPAVGALDGRAERARGRVALGVRFRRKLGEEAHVTGPRAYLDPPLAAGEVRPMVLASAAVPLDEGRWVGTVDLMREDQAWFEELGTEQARIQVEVEPVRGAIEVVHAPSGPVGPDGDRVVVRVRNDSPSAWVPGEEPDLGVGLRWFDAATDAPAGEPGRAYLDAPLGPGETRELTIPVEGDAAPAGRYRVRLNLLKEHLFWFEALGFPPVDLEIEMAGG